MHKNIKPVDEEKDKVKLTFNGAANAETEEIASISSTFEKWNFIYYKVMVGSDKVVQKKLQT